MQLESCFFIYMYIYIYVCVYIIYICASNDHFICKEPPRRTTNQRQKTWRGVNHFSRSHAQRAHAAWRWLGRQKPKTRWNIMMIIMTINATKQECLQTNTHMHSKQEHRGETTKPEKKELLREVWSRLSEEDGPPAPQDSQATPSAQLFCSTGRTHLWSLSGKQVWAFETLMHVDGGVALVREGGDCWEVTLKCCSFIMANSFTTTFKWTKSKYNFGRDWLYNNCESDFNGLVFENSLQTW